MTVTRNARAQRWEIAGEPDAFLQYDETPGRVRLIHTEVPDRLNGRGYGSALVQAALDDARDRRMRVDPACPFVRTFLRRHAEYAELVEPSHHHPPAEERRIRDAALDETIEASFPASDPPSSDPNPDDDDAIRRGRTGRGS
ncbi:MAG TPA: GNAT family N-acetyltransferase [Vicinamibacterales bacterium]|nr:GNAT family N-acetyltransferase [Vicinamibacterales bacterium]